MAQVQVQNPRNNDVSTARVYVDRKAAACSWCFRVVQADEPHARTRDFRVCQAHWAVR